MAAARGFDGAAVVCTWRHGATFVAGRANHNKCRTNEPEPLGSRLARDAARGRHMCNGTEEKPWAVLQQRVLGPLFWQEQCLSFDHSFWHI
jgi:hypothetical protein